MSRGETAYARLEARFRRWNAVSGANAVLGWDQEAMMPAGGAEARAEQMATLDVVMHEMLADPRVAAWLAEAEADAARLETWQRANLREMRRRHTHDTAAPADLVEANSRAISACVMTWREAKRKDDFSLVEGRLAEVVRLARELGAAKADRLGAAVYDAMIDAFEPDGSRAMIDPIFARLGQALPTLLDRILARQAAAPAPLQPAGPFPVEAQKRLGERVMAALGFDFERGRLDTSAHPFTGGVPDDIRITTRYDETDFTRALMGVIHETGHALYEMGLPKQWRGQPVGAARGMILHESQSLLMEMQACRSPACYRFLAPLAAQAFGTAGPALAADNLARLGHRVGRGLIRVDADEVTYPLHVMLRYELEQAMIAGDLAVPDLPGAWRDGMARFVGIVPRDDRDGCLQDIHWYSGAFGYFPTYTLGALAAAQLFGAVRNAVPDLDAKIATGDFAPLLSWIGDNVHALGSSSSTDQIMAAATGIPLGADAFLAHLEERYLG